MDERLTAAIIEAAALQCVCVFVYIIYGLMHKFMCLYMYTFVCMSNCCPLLLLFAYVIDTNGGRPSTALTQQLPIYIQCKCLPLYTIYIHMYLKAVK